MMTTKRILPLLVFFALCLGGCTATTPTSKNQVHQKIEGAKTTKHTKKTFKPTDPTSVVIASKTQLKKPFKVIGEVKIDRYNFVGIKRQQAVIDDLMQQNAADIGGNAIINVSKTHKYASGEIVRFEA